MTDPNSSIDPNQVIDEVTHWIDRVVVGLNLCPFAGVPFRANRIRMVVTEVELPEELLSVVRHELDRLETTPAAELETTLIIITKQLACFDDYNQFLDDVDELLIRMEFEGVFQVASFHPDYCFADTEPDAASNFTNRSPFPILHLLREASVSHAVDNTPDVDEIPLRNIARMEQLSEAELRALFPWRKGK